jgi:hypothetical protein
MLDSFAISNLIGENLSLKDRIIVNQIPSAQSHLATLLEAMQGNRVVLITYCGFNMHIPADTRSAFPVISVQSPVSIQCCWQS